MYTSVKNMLIKWNDTHSERDKLQHAYLALASALIITAGLIGLINYDLGQQMTAVALMALVVFFVNLVFWTLLQGLVLMRLDKESQSMKAVRPPKKSNSKKA